jgi:hypothetical protein
MDNVEEFDLVALTKANANQLNAADIASGAVTVRVTSVKNNKSADGKQPIAVHIDGGYKPWMPCLTVRRLLIKAWGNPKTWPGRRATLYNDPEVTYGKDKTGGIRVSHLSDIQRPVKVTLPVRRGVYVEYTILPMEADPVGTTPDLNWLLGWLKAGTQHGWTADTIAALLREHGSPDGKAANLPANKRATVAEIVKSPPPSHETDPNEPPADAGIRMDEMGGGK